MTDWIAEAVFQFLHSPEWTVPVMDYIDKNCETFEPGEENKLEYTTIHKEFSQLCESVLEKFLAELSITPEQFVAACNDARGDVETFVLQTLFAVDDFLSFKTMMLKRRAELDYAVLNMSATGQGTAEGAGPGLPHSAMFGDEDEMKRSLMALAMEAADGAPGDDDDDADAAARLDEEADLALAMSMSAAEHQAALELQESLDLEMAIALSLAVLKEELEKRSSDAPASDPAPSAAVAASSQREKGATSADKPSEGSREVARRELAGVENLKSMGDAELKEEEANRRKRLAECDKRAQAAALRMQTTASASPTPAAPVQPSTTPDEPKGNSNEVSDDMKRERAEYLRRQRNKLISKLEAEREGKLNKYRESKGKASPSPAAQEPAKQEAPKLSEEEEKRKQMRQALTAQLKADLLKEVLS